jgi:alkylation response protein AidB-like acyl-CoA dehydrogenase
MATRRIETPDDPALDELCDQLARLAVETDQSEQWPAEQLALCGRYGVYEWFLPRDWGGQAWGDLDLVRGYLKLSAACLTTTFIITQRTGACQRIANSDNNAPKERWLPGLASDGAFATVGISHLTTSRRHLGQPVMRAKRVDGGFELDGLSPWVTGGCHADVIVTGAELEDGTQILVALPTSLAGVTTPAPPRLVGVSASHTGEVHCQRVVVPDDCLLQGPAESVMRLGTGAGTGGLQTSTLAVGLSDAALSFLEKESQARPALAEPATELRREQRALESELLAMATGGGSCTNEQLRTRANSLVLRSSQAALAAAKGTGYVVGHPAGRWCREALFFLVWSCPQPVLTANLCELAGIESL